MTRRYEIQEMVSQDDQGVVFRAEDRETSKDVVVRRFFPNGRNGPGLNAEEQQAFLGAVEKLKVLKLKELRQTLDGGCDPVDGIPFLVTDWVEGNTLRAFTHGKPLATDSVRDILEVALKASQELSRVLGHEALWVGCTPDSIIIPESGRGITFWVSPLRSQGAKGLRPLADLADVLLGRKGGPADTKPSSDPLLAWIRQLRGNPNETLAEALAALHRPAVVASTGPISRAPGGTMTMPAPTGWRPPPRKSAAPKVLIGVAVTAFVLAGAGFALWQNGTLGRVVARFQGTKATGGGTTREEMIQELREKTAVSATPGSPVPAAASVPVPAAQPPATAPTPPATPPTPPPASKPPGLAPIDPTQGILGKVIDVSESSTGKTRYLEIFANGQTRWAGYRVDQNQPGLEIADLEKLVGKLVRITGDFQDERGHRGKVLQIRKREVIEVEP